MSMAGAVDRIWPLTRLSTNPYARVALTVTAVALIGCAWTMVLFWYCCFGLLLVPFRLLRRGQRKRKRQALQHREMLAAIERRRTE
jgi:hypothetical protein